MKADPFDTARALRWLRQLKKNNDRAWFAEHRGVYDEYLKPEWEELVTLLLVSATAFDERLAHVDPRRCLFRLYRDTRFSNDKTPYKTHLSAWISPLGKSGANPGFYFQVSPGDSLFACGIYSPEKPVLDVLRRHFTADHRPVERVLAAKRLAPYGAVETEPLRVTPRGIPKDHPRPNLVRARRYILRREYTDAEITKAGAFALFRKALADCAPFVAYLDDVVAGTRNEDDDE